MMMCLITDISSFFMIYAITERYMTHTVVRIMTIMAQLSRQKSEIFIMN